jgi:predicted metal-dependent hydrolase
MFDKLKKHPTPKATEKPTTAKSASAKVKRARNPEPEKTPEAAAPQSAPVHTNLQTTENTFVGIREYGSAEEIEEHINKQISQAKSALGEYLRQLDDVRGVAEKSKKLHDIVSKVSGKKQPKQNSEQIDVNGLEIVVDATPLHELDALENVLRSHQQRLLALQKAKEALEQLDPLGDTEGIRILVLEKHGIPQQILLKIS